MFRRLIPLAIPLPGNTLFYTRQRMAGLNPPWQGEFLRTKGLHGSLSGQSGFTGTITDKDWNTRSTISEL